MKENFLLLLLAVLLITGCGTPAPATSTSTPIKVFTPTNTEIPTSTPVPTVTPDPLAGSPEGTTGINGTGQWTKTTTEGETSFEWIWDKSLETWVRPLITKYPLLDSPNDDEDTFNFQIYIKEDVPGGDTFIEFTHKNVTSPDDESPLGCYTCSGGFVYFRLATRFNNQHGSSLQKEEWEKYFEFLKQEDKYLPLLLPDGKKTEVRLSPDSGIILTIVPPEDLIPLVEEGKARKFTSLNDGITKYIIIDGVDENGNALFRVATNIPLNKLWDIYLSGKKVEDYHLRSLIYLCVSNLLTREDQTELLNFSDASIYAQQSARPRVNGELDLKIIRAP